MLIEFSVPDRAPYELNATKHQKNKIWKMGYRNTEIMDNLGRDQAEFIINKIQSEYHRLSAIKGNRNKAVFFAICFIVGVIGVGFVPDSLQFIFMFTYIAGLILCPVFGVKYLIARARA